MQRKIDIIDYMLKHGDLPPPNYDSPENGVKLSLSEFQNAHTSEDNESARLLFKKEAKKLKEQYPWLWKEGIQVGSRKQIQGPASSSTQLSLVPRMTPQIEHENRLRALELGWTDERSSTLDTWKSKPLNNLMHCPTPHRSSTSQVPTPSDPKIEYGLTRFSEEPVKEESKAQPVLSRADTIKQMLAERISRSSTEKKAPEVNGYGFVTEKSFQAPATSSSHKTFTISGPTKREETLTNLLNKKKALRKQEKTNPLGVKQTTPMTVTSTRTRVSKTNTNTKEKIALTPAGSQLLSSLQRRSKSSVAQSPTVGRTFSSSVVRRPPTKRQS